MSKLLFLNEKCRQYHNLSSYDNYLLLVNWSDVQTLMTVSAYERFRGFLNTVEMQTLSIIEILPESAARLGFRTVWTPDKVHLLFHTSDF